MRLAFVTDVHFGPPAHFGGKLRKLSRHAPELLRAFVLAMNHDVCPDRVIQLGDAIEDESPESDLGNYRAFLEILAGLDAELLHVAGNHDLKHLTDQDLSTLWERPLPLYYRTSGVETQGTRVDLVVLRTNEQTGVDVRIADEQIEWLERTLSEEPNDVIVCVHHPLCDVDLAGNRWFEAAPHLCRVVERRRVREVLERSGKVRAVFQGHAHWNHLSIIEGIPYVTLQSLVENVDEDAPGRAARAYAVVDVTPRRIRVRIAGEERAQYQFDAPRRPV